MKYSWRPGFTQFSMVTIQRVRSETLRKSLWRVHLEVWRIDLTFLMEFEFICIIRYFIHPFVSFLPLIEQIWSGASPFYQYLEIYVLITFRGPEDPVNYLANEILPAIYVCLIKLYYSHNTVGHKNNCTLGISFFAPFPMSHHFPLVSRIPLYYFDF